MNKNYLLNRQRKTSLFAFSLASLLVTSCAKNQQDDQVPTPQLSSSTSYRVSDTEARRAAENIAISPEVYAQYRHSKETGDTQRVFRGPQRVRDLIPVIASDGQPAFYVCNFQQGGFALVAADRHMRPILAFDEHGL